MDPGVEFALLELSILLYWLSPRLICKAPFELTKTEEIRTELPGSILVGLHPQLNCVNQVFLQNIFLFDSIINQVNPSHIYSLVNTFEYYLG